MAMRWIFVLGILMATVSFAEEPATAVAPFNRWSGNSGGLFLGFSGIYNPKMAAPDRLNAGKVRFFDIGIELKQHMRIGIRYAGMTIPSLQTYNPDTFITTYNSNVKAFIFESWGGANIPLNEPYSLLGPVQFFIPVYGGLGLFSTRGLEDPFDSLTIDLATGAGVRLFSWSFVTAEMTGLYHFGIPIMTISQYSQGVITAQNSAGQTIKSNLSGFELRFGLTFILPDSVPGSVSEKSKEASQ